MNNKKVNPMALFLFNLPRGIKGSSFNRRLNFCTPVSSANTLLNCDFLVVSNAVLTILLNLTCAHIHIYIYMKGEFGSEHLKYMK